MSTQGKQELVYEPSPTDVLKHMLKSFWRSAPVLFLGCIFSLLGSVPVAIKYPPNAEDGVLLTALAVFIFLGACFIFSVFFQLVFGELIRCYRDAELDLAIRRRNNTKV
jgi:hypothetical protein